MIEEKTEVPNRKFRETIPLGWGYTYFARRGDLIKIGHTAIPKERIAKLRSASSERLDVLAMVINTIIDEPTAHKKFHHLRVRGEWFRADPELLDFIETVKATAAAMPKRPPDYEKPAHLEALRRQVLAQCPKLPREARNHAENLAQQIKLIESQEDFERIAPFMRRSMERLEATRQQ